MKKMKSIQYLINKLKLAFGKNSEDQFYENLFVNNIKWNQPEPNYDEFLRWKVIQSYVEFIINDSNSSNPLEILDLGCGRGWLTNLLSGYGVASGIEPVIPVVEYAKKIFPHVEFLSGTTKKILKQNNFKKYDLIVSSEVIEHIHDDKKDGFVKDIKKLLKDNGFVILTTPRKEAEEEWNSSFPVEQPVEDWITEAELESLLIKNSFQKLKFDTIAMSPAVGLPEVDIYQLWLFQKK
jgi:2-polyprenyl-3-methyl-5-hydroxy-6-metoxy-1,4-benzoquinol methylase